MFEKESTVLLIATLVANILVYTMLSNSGFLLNTNYTTNNIVLNGLLPDGIRNNLIDQSTSQYDGITTESESFGSTDPNATFSSVSTPINPLNVIGQITNFLLFLVTGYLQLLVLIQAPSWLIMLLMAIVLPIQILAIFNIGATIVSSLRGLFS
jgi:hypothetical protein